MLLNANAERTITADEENGYWTALMSASRHGHEEVVKEHHQPEYNMDKMVGLVGMEVKSGTQSCILPATQGMRGSLTSF